MTKKEMANAIAKETNLANLLVMEVIQRLFDGIIDTLAKDGRIELRNFGVFEVRPRRPRRRRNPRTGETVMVSAKKVVTFKPGLEMEERVRNREEMPAGKK